MPFLVLGTFIRIAPTVGRFFWQNYAMKDRSECKYHWSGFDTNILKNSFLRVWAPPPPIIPKRPSVNKYKVFHFFSNNMFFLVSNKNVRLDLTILIWITFVWGKNGLNASLLRPCILKSCKCCISCYSTWPLTIKKNVTENFVLRN